MKNFPLTTTLAVTTQDWVKGKIESKHAAFYSLSHHTRVGETSAFCGPDKPVGSNSNLDNNSCLNSTILNESKNIFSPHGSFYLCFSNTSVLSFHKDWDIDKNCDYGRGKAAALLGKIWRHRQIWQKSLELLRERVLLGQSWWVWQPGAGSDGWW